jgi:uncharacterized protein YggE
VTLLALALFAWCAPAFAQSEGIAVTASRTVDLAPDEITFSMAILTDPDVSLDQVLQACQSLGLATRDLLGINSQQFGPSPSQTRLAYTFDFTTAYSKFHETNDKLATLRRTLAAATPAMEVQIFAISVAPSDASREQARQGLIAPLFAEARQRADQLAKAAGMTLGTVFGFSEDWASATGPPGYGYYGPVGPGTLRSRYTLSVRYAAK